ncbi:hypothetical protein IEZ26_06695 [Nocardioides cavernae]|uniref:Uncharacterized protein n=1 Tax=Nocardioides cavernae TaxID=1921566 RepID=A0ABR8NCW1_9ACTN|nr:hypothetical protein [Nocardioides cavernae]MBD3924304.1 hypothetical protein [Nocardioides cavernae]MBM7510754.1 hypothetical protein [Nocardioides cavernae]
MTIYWKSGSSSTHRMSRQTVERMRMMIDERQGPDRLHLYDDAFMQYQSKEILLLEWTATPDYGWPLTPEEREAQQANGFHGGIITALVDLWRDEGGFEPSYSAKAMVLLHQGITETVDIDGFARVARRTEGRDGASMVQRAYAAVDVEPLLDDAEVNAAPSPKDQGAEAGRSGDESSTDGSIGPNESGDAD